MIRQGSIDRSAVHLEPEVVLAHPLELGPSGVGGNLLDDLGPAEGLLFVGGHMGRGEFEPSGLELQRGVGGELFDVCGRVHFLFSLHYI